MRRIELATQDSTAAGIVPVRRRSRTMSARDIAVFALLVSALLWAAWYSRTDARPETRVRPAVSVSPASHGAVAMR